RSIVRCLGMGGTGRVLGTRRVLWRGAVGDAPSGRLYVRALYAVGADEEPGRFVDRFDGGGEADAGRALLAYVVKAGEGEGEMGSGLVGEGGVGLVDDDGLDGAKDFAAALGS